MILGQEPDRPDRAAPRTTVLPRAHRGRLGSAETVGEPIRNPVTGAEHRARIDLPDGFEYRIAEMGSGTTRATAAIALPGLENTYAQFAHIHLSNKGIVD